MATAGNNLSAYKSSDLPNGAHFKVGIVVSEWNQTYTKGMLDGALEVLQEAGVPAESIQVHWVPGSFELPLASQWLVERDRIDGVVAIGCVIRGETAHFDHVCSATAQGIVDVNLKTGKPVMFCVLTDDNEAQSAARSGGEHGNKGVEAAVGLLKMLALRAQL
jgi:6,7-dimethyl-8-ribityllumazine synthase